MMCEDEAIEKSEKFLIELMASIKYEPKNITEETRAKYRDFNKMLKFEGFECNITKRRQGDTQLYITVSRMPGFFESNTEELEIYRREYSIRQMQIENRKNSINDLLD